MDKLFSNIQQTFNKVSKNPDKQSLLQRQQLTQEKINELLEQSTQALSCGPTCQKLKVSEELKQRYLDAETNMQTAPIKVEQTKKNYYIFTEGRPYYDNMKEEELKVKANKIADLLKENFITELSNANTMNTYLNTALINSQHTKDLFNHYLENNKMLKLKLRETRGDILTNDRKTYYETDALDRLKLWYNFFWYIYYLLVLTLIIALFLSPSDLNTIKKIIISIIILFYPYYIDFIVRWIHGLYTSIVSRLPKNVYNTL